VKKRVPEPQLLLGMHLSPVRSCVSVIFHWDGTGTPKAEDETVSEECRELNLIFISFRQRDYLLDVHQGSAIKVIRFETHAADI